MSHEWTLRHQSEIHRAVLSKFEARYPARDSSDREQLLPQFIQVKAQDQIAYFRTSKIIGGKGKEIIVSNDVLCEVPDEVPVTWEKISSIRYRWYIAWRHKEQQMAMFGFIIALIGIVIDAAFDIGKAKPIWTFKQEWVVFIKGFAWLLKATGLFLVFWKGLLSAR